MESPSRKLYRSLRYLAQSFKMALFGGLIIACVYAIDQFKLAKSFPIRAVQVYGLHHIESKEAEELLLPLVSRGFFNINVEYIRDRLLQLPWVADVSVRRQWPDRIEVTVVEKSAVARWNKQALLSEAGVLFAPKQETYPENLPALVGPDGKQMVMLNYFNEINRILIPLHAKISYLELTPYLTLKLKLDNGITLQTGRKDILIRLGYFVKVYPKIVGDRAADVDTIDLRYPNGVAIKWKTVEE